MVFATGETDCAGSGGWDSTVRSSRFDGVGSSCDAKSADGAKSPREGKACSDCTFDVVSFAVRSWDLNKLSGFEEGFGPDSSGPDGRESSGVIRDARRPAFLSW